MTNEERIELIKSMKENLIKFPPPANAYPSSDWWDFILDTLNSVLKQIESKSDKDDQ